MIHKIQALFVIIFLSSCARNVGKPGDNQLNGTYDFPADHIRYFYDSTIQKCFSERGSGQGYAYTCIPCDSIVLAAIKNQKLQQW